MSGITTLGQFIIEKQADFPYAKGELSRLLRDIGIAAKIVNREVNKAGLVDILGDAGQVSNDILQHGTKQVAAGYVIYGSSTMLVYTTGKGVNGFTLDPSIGEFCLSHPDMKIPAAGQIYSINEGNYSKFPNGVKQYIKYCQMEDSATQRPYASRYIGSMVADIHRNLLKGGIFLYPTTSAHPNGKLRLMYECNPIAFIIEQAGGKASNGSQRILTIEPKTLHQRSAAFLGNTEMVELLEDFLKKYSD